jgi:hypothetical protein
MAATMSDSDLAAVTGQSGVTIDISSMHIVLDYGTVTYGDLDGFNGTNSLGNDFTNAGYLNIAYLQTVPMHVGIGDIELVIDLGTSVTTSVTAVNIKGTMSAPITVDGILNYIYLDSVNGAAFDYASNAAIGSSYGPTFSPAYYTAASANLTKNIGLSEISNISILAPTFNTTISAH